MKSIKYLVWSFLAAGALLTACTEETYEPGAPESGSGVGFPVEVVTSYSVTDNPSIEIPVVRDNTDGALTVNVTSATSAVCADIPSQVSFAAGQSSTPLTITLDLDAFEYDSSFKVDLKLDAGVNTTNYKPQAITVTVSRPAPWVSLGMATYTDDFMTTFFSVSNETYEVEIQENQNVPGLYRLVNPYGEAYPFNDPGDWDESQDYYMEIHAEDPDAVWIPIAPMGFDWGYGEFSMGSVAGMYLSNGNTLEQLKAAGGILGTLQNGIITFPAKQLLISMADYNDGGLYYANNNGVFKIVLPGYTALDTSVAIELVGYFKDLEGQNYAVVDVTLGEDVEEVKLASGLTSDYAGLYGDIVSGAAETVSVTADGQVNVPIADGKNTIVAASYADGSAQEYDYITFTFYAGEQAEANPLEGNWTADDMYGITKQELFKRWIMWAVDYFDEDGNTDRQPLSYVTFAENNSDYYDEDYDEEYDLIDITGFSMGMTQNDTHQWEYYNGFLYNFYMHQNIGQVTLTNGAKYYLNYQAFVSTGTIYTAFYDEIMVGGLVADGYMAMAYSELYQLGSNPAPEGFVFRAWTDAACETTAAGNFEAIYNIMFEDPAVSSLSSVNKPVHVTTVENLNTLASQMKTPANYVELRGRARAHALIDELNAKNAAKQAAKLQIVDRKGQNNGRTLKNNAQAL